MQNDSYWKRLSCSYSCIGRTQDSDLQENASISMGKIVMNRTTEFYVDICVHKRLESEVSDSPISALTQDHAL